MTNNINNRLKIKFKSYDYILLEKSIKNIIKTLKNTKVKIIGPIPLPTKNKIFTVLRSPHVHKKSREQFILSLHRRYIILSNVNSNIVNNLMRLELARGIDVKISL